MADNYLERKYAEFQAQKTAAKSNASKKKTTAPHKMRRVFVTQGASGLGKALVKAFRMAGNRVAFCDSDEALGKETAEKTGTTFHLVDSNDKEALENCIQKILKDWGDLDIIVNCAATSHFTSLTETSADDFDRILSTHLRPVFITARLLANHRREQNTPNPYGRIINISPIPDQDSASESESYAMVSGALCSFTQSLSLSLAPLHITVNSITPDRMQYTGKPEDIARICLFLCQEDNDFMNGENISVKSKQG